MIVVVGICIAFAIGGGLIAVSVTNILHAVFGLALSLLGVAGIFSILGSPFVATMQVLVYIGGISVAMVFAVMLSVSIAARNRPRENRARKAAALFPTVIFTAILAWLIVGTEFVTHPSATGTEAWSVKAIGYALLTHYSLVFETLSVVLLVAIIGAIAIAQREPVDSETAKEGGAS